MAAAEAVLAEEGPAARIDAIALRAGVAVGTIYNHFGDRDGVVRAVMEAGRNAVLVALDAVLETPSGDFPKDLGRFLAVPAAHWREHGAFLAAVMTEHQHSQTFHSKRAEMMAAMQERAGRLLASGVAAGQVRAADLDRSIDYMVALIRGAIVLCALDGRTLPDPQHLADLFLHGVAPRPWASHAVRVPTEKQ